MNIPSLIVGLTGMAFCGMNIQAAWAEDRAPLPASIAHAKSIDPEVLQLKKLLDDHQIIPFYQKAYQLLKSLDRYGMKTCTVRELTDGLFLYDLVARAPFIDLDRPDNVIWVMTHRDLDHTVKQQMAGSVPFKALLNKKLKLPDQQKALEFYLSATAYVMKQFRTSIDPDFAATFKREDAKAQADPKLMGNEVAEANFYNRLATMEARNTTMKSTVLWVEPGFVKELMKCFPTKANEVKKYIRLAGYAEEEIPALLDRTIGRTPEAEYLYKGLPKRKE